MLLLFMVLGSGFALYFLLKPAEQPERGEIGRMGIENSEAELEPVSPDIMEISSTVPSGKKPFKW
jgi:hypothetical protein